MALSFIILTLLIAGSIIAWSYTMYVPFFMNIQQNAQQTQAYYIARAAIERWQLALQYHPLWFAGSGGFDNGEERWPLDQNNIAWEDINITKMWWTTNNQNEANKENKIYLHKPIKIYLGYDNTTNPEQYYQNISNHTKYEWTEISIDIDIPDNIEAILGETNNLLCDTENPWCDTNGDMIYDDTIIQRDRKGQEWRWDFNIIPYTSTKRLREWGYQIINYDEDTNIRESIINIEDLPTLIFGDTFNPLAQNELPDTQTWHNFSWTTLSGIQWQTFSDILANNSIEYNMLSLHMTHPAIRRDDKIYPYMNYQINWEDKLASPINTIQAYAQTNQNRITIQARKPNILTQEKGSFTIETNIYE